MRTDSTNIGETIRLLRRARNILRAEMAKEIGISMSHLEKIESGARRPGIDTYQKIFGLLGLIRSFGIRWRQYRSSVLKKRWAIVGKSEYWKVFSEFI